MDLALVDTTSSAFTSVHKHDVFISFRGEDTRTNFTSHLYEALVLNNIKTYMDEETLRKGEEISVALSKAIRGSRISLIIFSKNYASSTWCLDELVHILKCREENGQIVVPIFYDVDPSHVRNQKESYACAFVEHELCFKDRMEKPYEWRDALRRAANLSGWDSRVIRNEAKLVKEIVQKVDSLLKHIISPTVEELKNLAGIEKNLEKIESLLHVGSPDVRIIGLPGMGSIGKSTLARFVFHKLSTKFDGSSFLEDVGEESKRYGLASLESKLFSELLKEEDKTNVSNRSVKNIIRRKKFLIVLDDVTDKKQLERVARYRSWLGSGSRIIITTRDKKLLRHSADVIYESNGLSYDQAAKVFLSNPFEFGSSLNNKDHVELSKSMTKYIRKVSGSFLQAESKEKCESTLSKLKSIVPADFCFSQMLKSWFKGLGDAENGTGLHKTFLEGKDKDLVERKLKESGSLFGREGIQALLEKSRTRIEGDGQVWMDNMEAGAVEGSHFDVSKNIESEELQRRHFPSTSNPDNHVRFDMPSEPFWNKIQDTSSSVRLFISYEGQWNKTGNCWSFDGQRTRGITVSKDITYHNLVERLYSCLKVDRLQYDLDMRFLVNSAVPTSPLEIESDEDVDFFICENSGKDSLRYPLCITLIRKDIGQDVSIAN